jgi:programmed cell death 6-interacting protein
MKDKNSRIYISSIPDVNSLAKIDKKIMVNASPIPDNLQSLVENGQSKLDGLVPKEVKPMIEAYKNEMMAYITENLNNYENEDKITNFLVELDLPFSLEAVLSQSEISESLWKKINAVQQKGGTLFMTNNLSSLSQKGEAIIKRIEDITLALKIEEEEDEKYKKQYGDRWTRTSSKMLNHQYLSVLEEYKSILNFLINRKIGGGKEVRFSN